MTGRILLLSISAATLSAASGLAPIQPPVMGLFQHRADYVGHLERFFRVIDTKGRGYFTGDDLVLPGYHIAYPPIPFPQAQLQAPFRCVDANRDGRISQQEYVDYGARAFDATIGIGFFDPVKFSHAIAPSAGCK